MVLFRKLKKKNPGLSKMQAAGFISRINKDLFERLPREKVPGQRAGEGKISHRTQKHTQVTGLLEAGTACGSDEVACFP